MRLQPAILGVAMAATFLTAQVYAGPQHGHVGAPPATGTKPAAPTTTVKTTTTTAGASKSATTGTTGTTTLNPIAVKIAAKPQLNTKVTTMLPKNLTLDQASSGFKNQGQFIAALHVSRNLGIPFKGLKTDMTKKNMSLGQSIQDLKKSANAKTEAVKGENEAKEDVKSPAVRQPIARTISSNPQLDAKVQALLPSTLTLAKAAKGFTSESQFLAALHASKDLGIPFAQIKAEMTGHDHDSLRRAIQELKPAVDATTAAKTAQTEAAADIKSTSTTPTATATLAGQGGDK